MIRIERGSNPYHDEVQGKANEPITVAGLLDRAEDLEHPLEEICERLDANAPRIAIIGGSPDHPAHILDDGTALKAASRIWTNGGFCCHGCGVRGHVRDYADLNALATMVWDRTMVEHLEAAGQLRIPGT